MFKNASLSPCEQYRYQLERRTSKLAAKRSTVAFIGLNPSTADASVDDPTIRRCTNFALKWHFKTMIMVNLFARRATEPTELKQVNDPIGIANDDYINEALGRASLVIACWGEHGILLERASEIRSRHGRRLHALKLNRSGQPAHPLYLSGTLTPVKLAKLERLNKV